MHSYNKTNEMH